MEGGAGVQLTVSRVHYWDGLYKRERIGKERKERRKEGERNREKRRSHRGHELGMATE